MDSAVAQALVASIQNLPVALKAAHRVQRQAQGAQGAAAQNQANPSAAMMSPFESDALDLSFWVGSSLYAEGGSELSNEFTGKIEDFQHFMSNLEAWITKCRWNDQNHKAFQVTINGLNYNLISQVDQVGKTWNETNYVASDA